LPQGLTKKKTKTCFLFLHFVVLFCFDKNNNKIFLCLCLLVPRYAWDNRLAICYANISPGAVILMSLSAFCCFFEHRIFWAKKKNGNHKY